MPDRWLFTALTLCLVSLVDSSNLVATEPIATAWPKSPAIRHPAFLTRYDLATHDDLFAARMLDPLIRGDQPDEWIVGRELGHLKCGHARMKHVAYGVLVAVQGISLAIVPDKAQVILPTLGLGRLCSWIREAEITTDRAGLLCCQDPQAAYNALSRLLHGLGAGSTWIDPEKSDFDPDALVKEYCRWKNEPFVKFIQYVKRFSAESPDCASTWGWF